MCNIIRAQVSLHVAKAVMQKAYEGGYATALPKVCNIINVCNIIHVQHRTCATSYEGGYSTTLPNVERRFATSCGGTIIPCAAS